MTKIKNIIFDLGGVLLKLNYSRVPEKFAELGFENFNAIYSQAKQDGLFNDFETGKMSSESFRNNLRTYKKEMSDCQIDECWNSILIDFPQESLDYLNSLKNEYRLFLLSNTNEIHVEAFTKILDKSIGYLNYIEAFEKVYYSNEIGLRKPNKECFQFVIEQNKLKVSETLFIDDTQTNIDGAESLNIKTFLYPQNKDLKTILTDVLA